MPLQHLPRLRRSMKLAARRVDFFQRSPYWQKSRSVICNRFHSSNCRRIGVSQQREVFGFSKITGILRHKQTQIIRIEKKNNSFPVSSFARSLPLIHGRPIGCASLRRGPGPNPSLRRARLKVVHGMPSQTIRTTPDMRRSMMRSSTSGSRTSSAGSQELSMPKESKPRAATALCNLPHPEKISKKHGEQASFQPRCSGALHGP